MSFISRRLIRECANNLFSNNGRLFIRYRKLTFSPIAYYSSINNGDNKLEKENSNPPASRSTYLDKVIVPATVMATGVMLSPGLKAMLTKPLYLWFYKRFYDLRFDVNEFLVGARRALYFVAEKAFRRDFFGLRDVLTPEVSYKFITCMLYTRHAHMYYL
jgi:hypothetical protein